MIVYNTGNNPIFICTDFEADPKEGPAIQKTTYYVAPGDGVDLSMIGLEPRQESDESPADYSRVKGV